MQRINTLDSFRGISVIIVMLSHFLYGRPHPNTDSFLLPYEDKYEYFDWGGLGVMFFFIISGFVIFYTLEKTSTFKQFWVKRFIRLYPSLIIAILLTFTVAIFFDYELIFPRAHKLHNTIMSSTFIPPQLLNVFSQSIKFEYTDGVYWSLWPEIQFYLLMSILFFKTKKPITLLYIITLTTIIINVFYLKVLDLFITTDNFPFSSVIYTFWFKKILNLSQYLPYFTMGVLFYKLYLNNKVHINTILIVPLAIFSFTSSSTIHNFVIACFIALFFLFIYYPKILKPLNFKYLQIVGFSSYFLYLIHQEIGIILMYYIKDWSLADTVVLPILASSVCIVLSVLYTRKVDFHITSYLKAKLIKK
ncbi:acyltransferase family protein [Saccharicrinis sp. 156]|uniref:acyltransferase family protein n=1 Tax=Saccharicrinis sp. 156 TaxID=3417574 RepID=UPI003D3531AB